MPQLTFVKHSPPDSGVGVGVGVAKLHVRPSFAAIAVSDVKHACACEAVICVSEGENEQSKLPGPSVVYAPQ
jgi:hypothetical protein